MKNKILIFFFIFISIAYADEKWNFEFSRDGISVFTREVQGSPLKAFMAEGDINAPVESVNSILCDNPLQVMWVPDCIVSKDIMKDSEGRIISYNETKAPVVNNRDVIVETKIARNNGVIIHEFRALDRPDLATELPGRVRIKDMSGRWKLTPAGNGTHVIFEVRANPGGIIPAWLANMASRDIPYRTLLGLRKIAERR